MFDAFLRIAAKTGLVVTALAALLVPGGHLARAEEAPPRDQADTPAPPLEASEGLPLWEVGVGAIGVYAPDYPAASEHSLNGLPIPYVIYRGDIFRVEEGRGARVVPVDTPRYEVGVSADAAFGTDGEDNDAREGMPELDTLFQLGPELVIRGPRGEGDNPGQLDLALQGRVVFSVDPGAAELGYRGLVFQPRLRYLKPGVLGKGSRFRASVGPILATEELHDYFYEVDPQFARAERETFGADAGYLGTEINLSLRVSLTERLRAFTGTEIGFYRGAANQDSPLYEEDLTAAVFLGFAYSLFQSDRRVQPRRR